jgi:hypothetical protein
LAKGQKREAREREKEVKPQFAIGSTVQFGTESFVVDKYHKPKGEWEVEFKSLDRGHKRSVLCSQLALHVNS